LKKIRRFSAESNTTVGSHTSVSVLLSKDCSRSFAASQSCELQIHRHLVASWKWYVLSEGHVSYISILGNVALTTMYYAEVGCSDILTALMKLKYCSGYHVC